VRFQKSSNPSYLAPDAGPSAKDAPAPRPSVRLYSIPALLRSGRFEGQFNARSEGYRFTYAPDSAALAKGRLELTGTVAVHSGQGQRTAAGVRARLLATQGSVADAPPRRQALAPATAGSTLATSDQKQEQAKAPELQQAAVPEAGRDRMGAATEAKSGDLPVTESTGPSASAGVLYFELQPLDGAALGIPVDLKRVQLNVRLAPDSERDRDLFWLWADVVAAIARKGAASAAAEPLRRLNAALKG